MAEDKKGFILYADTIDLVEELTDDEAGRLFKHILRYVNDKNPEAPDRVTKIAFEPIKNQLKRDLKKYEVKKDIKKESGVIGNLKRWHVDLYEKFILNEISLEKAVEMSKISPPIAGDRVATIPIANIAVTDTVNVTVKDTVTVNVIKKTKEERIALFTQKVLDENNLHKILEPPDIIAFLKYWNESGESQKKIRFELEKIFEIKRRLETWRTNKFNFKQNGYTGTNQQTTTFRKDVRERGQSAGVL